MVYFSQGSWWPAAAVIIVLALVFTWWSKRRFGDALPLGVACSILAARLAAWAILAMLVLAPYGQSKRTDFDRVVVELLFDVSGSMATPDLDGGETRLAAARKLAARWFDGNLSLASIPADKVIVHSFAERRRRQYDANLAIAPGGSAIGDTLIESLRDNPPPLLAAVLLVSDGNSNSGAAAPAAAALLRDAGVPISAIGIGGGRVPGDLRIRSESRGVIDAPRGVPVDIPLMVYNSFDQPRELEITASEGGRVVARRAVRVPPGVEAAEKLTVPPSPLGTTVYRLRIEAAGDVGNPATNVDYAAVRVAPPDTFKLLLLAAAPDWNPRFLGIMAAANPQIMLRGVVKLGEGKFKTIVRGFGDEDGDFSDTDGWPGKSEIFKYDLVVADAAAVAAMDDPETLVEFVGRRGGGLLLSGDPEAFGEELKALLPFRAASRRGGGDRRLELGAPFIFPPESAASLNSPPGPQIAEGESTVFVSELKPGARAALLADDGSAALATQRYGAGNVAYLGADWLWRWALADPVEMERYRSFWGNLAAWLGGGGKQRLTPFPDGGRAALLDEAEVGVELLDADYRSAVGAEVVATITSPSGRPANARAHASPNRPGVYTTKFTPGEIGEYKMEVTATFADGETLSGNSFFVSANIGAETANPEFRGDVLRDLARITGGKYYDFPEVGQTLNIPVAGSIPEYAVPSPWLDSRWLLAALLAAFCLEWFIRRQIAQLR